MESLHCMFEYALIRKNEKHNNIFICECESNIFDDNYVENTLNELWRKRKSENHAKSNLTKVEIAAYYHDYYLNNADIYCINDLYAFYKDHPYVTNNLSDLVSRVAKKYRELLANCISTKYFKPIAQSLYEFNHIVPFFKNERIESIIEQLRCKNNSVILITALSGIGKSRMIYESFREEEDDLNILYAKYVGNTDLLETEFKHILTNQQQGILIIDDCPWDILKELNTLRKQLKSEFRIIAANNDYYNDLLNNDSDIKIIKVEHKELIDCVNLFVEDKLSAIDMPVSNINQIKRLSDGYPQIAIEFVTKCLENKSIGLHTVEYLMPKLLNLNPQEDKDEIAIMQTLSLCMPFPYSGQSRDAFKYMLSMEHITSLDNMDYLKRRSLAEHLIRKYNATFIDVCGDWLNVRPFPLSMWLTEQWFENVCNCGEHFKELIEDIQQQNNVIQNIIVDGFCRHIKQMYGVKSASDLVEKLTNLEECNPFFTADVMCSRLGSKLFLAMSTINPSAVANCLYEIVDAQSIVWLKQRLTYDYRRSIVFALEKLCFAKDSYCKAVMTMAKLAVAENDNLSNNATGLLRQLFHVWLSGTEVDLKTRLDTLQSFVNKGEEYEQITISCIKSAFNTDRSIRNGDSERFGLERKTDYVPKSDKEVLDYWYACRDFLTECLEQKPTIVDVIGTVVEDNTYAWIAYNLCEILFPLLEKVSSVKHNIWYEEYAALKRTKRLIKDLDESIATKLADWINKLKPKSFIADLKDAQQEIISKYKLPNEERVKLAREIIEPLVQTFINERIYENKDELKTIITDNQYNDYWFANAIVERMSHKIMVRCFDTMFDIIIADNNIKLNTFFVNFCEVSKNKYEYQDFLAKLLEQGNLVLYINLLAYTEYEDYRNFKHITETIKDGKFPKKVLQNYLFTYRPKNNGDYENIVILFREAFPNENQLLGNYIINNHFYADNFNNSEYLCAVLQTMVNYLLTDETEHNIYEYAQFVIEILEKTNNKEFAAEINKKMIDLYNSKMTHIGYKGVFSILLHKYLDTIWDYFSAKLISSDYSTFFYQVKDEIGSGTGFGKGALFQTDDARIRQLCVDNPETAPSLIALMAPCFDPKYDNQMQDHFSEWFIWLLDNYGNKREVRSNLDCNLGSFAWTGTTIPYHQRNIKSFEKLYDHKFEEVREWARLCVKGEKERLQHEKRFDDYERMSEM